MCEFKRCGAVLAAAMLSSVASAAVIVIDDFSQATAVGYPVIRTSVDTPGDFPGVVETVSNVPGGQRGLGINGISFDVFRLDDAPSLVSPLAAALRTFSRPRGSRQIWGCFKDWQSKDLRPRSISISPRSSHLRSSSSTTTLRRTRP